MPHLAYRPPWAISTASVQGLRNVQPSFVIFRCTYSNDKAWARFKWDLNERVRLELKQEGAEDLFERTDWLEQKYPPQCYAGQGTIRRHIFAKTALFL